MSITINIVYFCPVWKNHQKGYLWELSPSGFVNRRMYYSLSEFSYGPAMAVPIDPMTVISLGMATPYELEIPPGLEAAFNLLK